MRSFLFKLGAFNSYVLGMKSRELFAVYKEVGSLPETWFCSRLLTLHS